MPRDFPVPLQVASGACADWTAGAPPALLIFPMPLCTKSTVHPKKQWVGRYSPAKCIGTDCKVETRDKTLEQVTCIRLDASVVTACSDKELAEPNFKGFGHHPLLAYCDNTAEPLAGKLRRGGAAATPPPITWKSWVPRRSPRCRPLTGGG